MIQKYIVYHREYSQYFYNFKWSVIYKNIESPCYPPETNIILWINCTLIKKIECI